MLLKIAQIWQKEAATKLSRDMIQSCFKNDSGMLKLMKFSTNSVY
jgi:hypothetical protein